MGMTTAFFLSWREDFCKRLIVLGTSIRMFWQKFSLPSIVQHVPWLAPLLREVPFLAKDPKTLRSFALKQSQKRAAQVENYRKDLFSYLVSHVYWTTLNRSYKTLMNGVAWSNQTQRNDVSTECHCIKFSSCHRRGLGYHCVCTLKHHLLSYLQSRVSATSQTWAWWISCNLSWGTHKIQFFGYTAFLECCNVRYTSSFHTN